MSYMASKLQIKVNVSSSINFGFQRFGFLQVLVDKRDSELYRFSLITLSIQHYHYPLHKKPLADTMG